MVEGRSKVGATRASVMLARELSTSRDGGGESALLDLNSLR